MSKEKRVSVRRKNAARPSDNKYFRRLQISMIAGYAVIVAAAVVFVAVFAIRRTDEALKNKVIVMASSLSRQMDMNLESHLSRMETIGTLIFGIDESYTYDATDPDNDEFEAVNTEKIISDKLYSLCIMENFVDYGIVYRNNRTVGKAANDTGKCSLHSCNSDYDIGTHHIFRMR